MAAAGDDSDGGGHGGRGGGCSSGAHNTRPDARGTIANMLLGAGADKNALREVSCGPGGTPFTPRGRYTL